MQLAMHMVTIEDLMPQGHFLRKLEAALDLSFVYEETAPLYSKKYGRPAIDPVVIVKYLLVGFLYGIPSERQIERRVQTHRPALVPGPRPLRPRTGPQHHLAAAPPETVLPQGVSAII